MVVIIDVENFVNLEEVWRTRDFEKIDVQIPVTSWDNNDDKNKEVDVSTAASVRFIRKEVKIDLDMFKNSEKVS